MTVGERIKYLRLQQGLTQSELAQAAKTQKQTIHKYETGLIRNIPSDKIRAIASKLGTTPPYLMGWDDLSPELASIENISAISTLKVPLIGTIACGKPITAVENIEAYIDVDNSVRADFALRCRGDSMINARIFDGDIVYIRRQQDVENGEIAAVLIDNEATLKRVYKYADRVELRPENPTYEVLNFEGEELRDVRILGKAVAFLSGVK